MAYTSYGMATQGPTQGPIQTPVQPQTGAMPQSPFGQQQNIQPLFPQPQGNVYNINSTLEVANVPVGAGMSVALCLPENVMYIKTMQNGNPLFYPYKVISFTQNDGAAAQGREETQTSSISLEDLADLELPGRWLVTMSGHITCIIDGVIYDVFDPSDRYMWCAYQVDE